MRGKISDQDLTNYALNDGLDSRERLYVESMLGISEECRSDVYRSLDLATMLEAGFEAEEDRAFTVQLTAAQRERLLQPPVVSGPVIFLRRTATSLALAACVAFAFANPRFWEMQQHSRRVAAVSGEVSRMVSEAMASGESDIALWVNPPTVSMPEAGDDDSSAFIQTSSDLPAVPSVTVCTPPAAGQPVDYSIPE